MNDKSNGRAFVHTSNLYLFLSSLRSPRLVDLSSSRSLTATSSAVRSITKYKNTLSCGSRQEEFPVGVTTTELRSSMHANFEGKLSSGAQINASIVASLSLNSISILRTRVSMIDGASLMSLSRHVMRRTLAPKNKSIASLPSNFPTFQTMGLEKHPKYETLKLEFIDEYVLNVQMNRPKELNTFNRKIWVGPFLDMHSCPGRFSGDALILHMVAQDEIKECWNIIADDSDVRCVVLSANGRLFSAGLDLSSISIGDAGAVKTMDPARIGFSIVKGAKDWQDTFNAVEKCDKPTIAVIHNACIGAGVDFITACDIRVASEDARFSVREVDIGIAADVGTLQRLPKIVGNESVVRELALTGRFFSAAEADKIGMLSGVFPTKEKAFDHAVNLAKLIASKSPVATAGTKNVLVHARDHSVEEGLRHVAVWNASMIQTADSKIAEQSFLQKKKAVFPKL